VQAALATLPVTERIEYVRLVVTIDYSRLTALQQLCAEHEAETLDQEFAEQVRVSLRVPDGNAGRFRAAVLDATRGQASVLDR
jgi:putative IMPACT (imprinted ancient) family translation regulator